MMRPSANRLFYLALLLMILPAVAYGAPVTRSLSTAEPGAGEVFTVSLSVGDMPLGGVVETLPGGYIFAGTEHPDDRTLIQGQMIAFTVADEAVITYSVKAPASGSGDIVGVWEDFAAEAHGKIVPSHVAVDGVEVPEAGGSPPTDVQAASPLPLLTAIAGLFLAAHHRGGRR